MPAQPNLPDSPDLDPRVILASERTLLAWIRTGLAMMGFGFVVARFGLFLRELASAGAAPEPHHLRASQWVGFTLIVLGVVVNLLAAVQHARFLRAYTRGQLMRPRIVSMGTILSLVLAGLGIALAVYLSRV
jgi:putative membrane protein